MKRIGTGLAIMVFGIVAAGLARSDEADDFNATARKLQPAPTGHVVGKDNGAGTGTHNAGEECGACHRAGGRAPVMFTASGTLYEDRAGRKPLAGAEIILEDLAGNVISMTTNEVGNFWTFAPIASNPYAVVSHGGETHPLYTTDAQGFHPADPNDTRTWQYKAWVRNGDQVRPMITIAPVGGATDGQSRMSCNMHHAPMGSRGALWSAGKSTLASYPDSGLRFRQHILPIFRARCVPCHIPGATASRVVTQSDYEGSPSTVVDYSSQLDLSSYEGSSVTVGETTWTKRGIKDVTAPYAGDPSSSPVLLKTRRQAGDAVVHGGGAFWTEQDADYRALARWMAEGASGN